MVYGSGLIFSNDVSTSSVLSSMNVGDNFACAVDLDNRKFWVRENGGNWNNSGTANPATNVGGFTIGSGTFAPAIGFGLSSINHNMTINLGSTAFVYTVPSGFTAGWPV